MFPKAESKHAGGKKNDETLTGRHASKKEKKRRMIVHKPRSSAIFQPNFKKIETTGKLIYMTYIRKSSTVVFFTDLYDALKSNRNHISTRLFDLKIPKREEACFSPPLHCNGLLLLPTGGRILVCNPATKEAIALPQTREHLPRKRETEIKGYNVRVGLGFVPSTQAYKVTHFFYRSFNTEKQSYSMGFEVFTIGVSSSWRLLDKDPPYPIMSSLPMVSGCRFIYFHIWHPAALYAPNAFLRFDLKNEKFSVLHPPSSLKRVYVGALILTNLQNRLSLCAPVNNTKFSVFTAAKEGPDVQWVPKYCFNVVFHSGRGLVTPIVEHGGKLLIRINEMSSQRLVCYDTNDGSAEEVNGESEDYKMKREAFSLFAGKPWFHLSSFKETLFRISS